jgi:hypothetical protein
MSRARKLVPESLAWPRRLTLLRFTRSSDSPVSCYSGPSGYFAVYGDSARRLGWSRCLRWVGLLYWGSAVVLYLFILLNVDGGYVRLSNEGFFIKHGYRERFLSCDAVDNVEVKTPGRWVRLSRSSKEPYVTIRTSVRPGWPFSCVFCRGLEVRLDPGQAEDFAEALKARLKA